jgi:hypothetical protein
LKFSFFYIQLLDVEEEAEGIEEEGGVEEEEGKGE